MSTLETSGQANIKLPGHDYRDAKYTMEQTAESIKSKFVWDDGLEVEYTVIAGEVHMNTNGKIYIQDETNYIIRLD